MPPRADTWYVNRKKQADDRGEGKQPPAPPPRPIAGTLHNVRRWRFHGVWSLPKQHTPAAAAYATPPKDSSWRHATADDTLRLVAVTADKPDVIVGYILLDREFSADERRRYEDYGVELGSADRRIAPVVGPLFRKSGIGTALLRWTADLLTTRGIRQLILFGGTQTRNSASISLYRKTGFRELGRFAEKGLDNIDMYLPLNTA